jgi:hypothetical protein
MSSKPSMALAALLAAGAACSLPAAAEQDRQQGMVVVRDAQTGQLRNATPAEVKALRAQETRRGLVAPEAASAVTIRRDGTMQKHLGERGMVYSVVTRDANGKLGTQCVNGEDAAKAALEHPAPATKQEHDHESR